MYNTHFLKDLEELWFFFHQISMLTSIFICVIHMNL